jgi:hypothetical protein
MTEIGDVWEIAAAGVHGSDWAARTSLGDSGAWYGPRPPALGVPAGRTELTPTIAAVAARAGDAKHSGALAGALST